MDSSSACPKPRWCSRSSGARSCPARSSRRSSPQPWSTAPPRARPIVGRFEPGEPAAWSSTPTRPRRAARRSTPTASAGRPGDDRHDAGRTPGRPAHAAGTVVGDAARRRACIADADAAERARRRGRRAHRGAAARARAACAPSSPSAYAKEREQFGRVIGSFQAVKHLCADMLVRAEVARAAVYAAGGRARRPQRRRPRPRVGRAAKIAGRRRRDRQRQGVHPGARRHRVHVGGRRAALLEARHVLDTALRQQRRARRGRRRHALTRRSTSGTATSTGQRGIEPWGSATGAW